MTYLRTLFNFSSLAKKRFALFGSFFVCIVYLVTLVIIGWTLKGGWPTGLSIVAVIFHLLQLAFLADNFKEFRCWDICVLFYPLGIVFAFIAIGIQSLDEKLVKEYKKENS